MVIVANCMKCINISIINPNMHFCLTTAGSFVQSLQLPTTVTRVQVSSGIILGGWLCRSQFVGFKQESSCWA
jgi:hypothetical protein